ncbi:hypothetical protein [Singulisphaera sp. PoT]|uniref:hypothetical protein n=1 Tax=Singulisphaera sp. PoT TaxID=3411797 RepID=UPI003BF5EBA8
MELNYVYGTAAVMVIYFLIQLISKKFDPFAPVWLFFVGYVQVYVVQALSYHDWALGVRGPDVVLAANQRAFWALIWFLFVYHCGVGNLLSKLLPKPPTGWSSKTIGAISPVLIIWGLICSGIMLRNDPGDQVEISPEAALLHSFPFVMLVAAIMLIVTGRTGSPPRKLYFWAGVATGGLYVLIWMFNGKRSHSLVGVLSVICAVYVSKFKRPSWPVLISTAVCGLMAVVIAISWRYDRSHERTFSGFVSFLADFDPAWILQNMNIESEDDDNYATTKETTEYGGFLLMMDVVPYRSDFDFGMNYLRVFSTFIPRIVWPEKPLFGREQWVKAWIAGSEMKRDADFAGPAIGLMGATQLNGGATGTFIVMACIGIFLRMAYTYFLTYSHVPWVQTYWAISYYNAWFMVVNDDPLIWFYYNYGFTTMPLLVFLWFVNRFLGSRAPGPFPGHEGAPSPSYSQGSYSHD